MKKNRKSKIKKKNIISKMKKIESKIKKMRRKSKMKKIESKMKKRTLKIKRYSNNNWKLCIDFVFLINTNWKYGIVQINHFVVSGWHFTWRDQLRLLWVSPCESHSVTHFCFGKRQLSEFNLFYWLNHSWLYGRCSQTTKSVAHTGFLRRIAIKGHLVASLTIISNYINTVNMVRLLSVELDSVP